MRVPLPHFVDQEIREFDISLEYVSNAPALSRHMPGSQARGQIAHYGIVVHAMSDSQTVLDSNKMYGGKVTVTYDSLTQPRQNFSPALHENDQQLITFAVGKLIFEQGMKTLRDITDPKTLSRPRDIPKNFHNAYEITESGCIFRFDARRISRDARHRTEAKNEAMMSLAYQNHMLLPILGLDAENGEQGMIDFQDDNLQRMNVRMDMQQNCVEFRNPHYAVRVTPRLEMT